MSEKLNAPWLFVIDTEDYSGNFERELCAYITGRVGECGVGDDMAEIFKNEVKDMGEEPFSNVMEENDEHGCYRPASIYPTPGWYNDGMGGHYKIGDEKRALENYRKNAAAYHRNSCYVKYYEDWKNNPNNRDRYIKSGWTEKKLKKAVDEEEKKAQEIEKSDKLSKYEAYLSVAISFSKKPTQKQIDLMKQRAQVFAQMKSRYGTGTLISKITGFRLIENEIKRSTKEESV